MTRFDLKSSNTVLRAPLRGRAFHRAGPGRGASSLERRLSDEIQAGRLRLTDARAGAHMLFTMALGQAHMWLLLGLSDTPDEAAIDGTIAAAVEAFLYGLLVQHAPGGEAGG